MADVTKTISVGMNLFGGAPSSKWGQAVANYTMSWGVTKWGEGTSTVPFVFVKLISSNAITLDSSISKTLYINMTISNTLPMTGAPSYESLRSGVWDLVFVPDSINAVNRAFTSWGATSGSAASYTCGSAGSTIWT